MRADQGPPQEGPAAVGSVVTREPGDGTADRGGVPVPIPCNRPTVKRTTEDVPWPWLGGRPEDEPHDQTGDAA